MFFQEQEINEDLICQHCKQRYDVPLILPCGETICKKCVYDHLDLEEDEEEDSAKETTKKQAKDDESLLFECLVCDQEHSFRKNVGLPINKPLLSLLNKKAKEIFRGELAKDLKQHLLIIDDKRAQLLQKLASKLDCVKDYFEIRRQQIYAVTDSKQKEIDDRSKELLNEIDNLERECLDQMKENQQLEKALSTKAEESIELSNEWCKRLASVDLDENQVKEANQRAKKIKHDLDHLNEETDQYLFNSQTITFEENESTITADILGVIVKKKFRCLTKNDLKEIKIKNLDKSESVISMCFLDDGRFLIAYHNSAGSSSNFQIHFSLFNSKGIRICAVDPGIIFSKKCSITCTSLVNSKRSRVLVACYSSNSDHHYLYVIDHGSKDDEIYKLMTCLDRKIAISMPLISADDQLIYIFQYGSVNVRIYDWSLEPIRTMKIDVRPDYGFPIHVSNKSTSADASVEQQQHIYIVNNKELCVLSAESGHLIQKIPIQVDSAVNSRLFFTNRSLFIIKADTNKLTQLDLASVTNQLNQSTKGLDLNDLAIDIVCFNGSSDKMAIYDLETSAIYIEN